MRFISNRSSGPSRLRLGRGGSGCRGASDVGRRAGAIAYASRRAPHRRGERARDEGGRRAEVGQADIFVSVAAVADYRPSEFYAQKLKKTERNGNEMSIVLHENDDIVGSIAGAQPRPFVVGFAAETRNALAYGREKRLRKKMDAIVVNDVSDETIGFDSADNAVTLIHDGGETAIEKMPKAALSRRLVAELAILYAARKHD